MNKPAIIPKYENADKGYTYTVTDEQIAAYAKWTLDERLQWVFDTYELVSQLQTPEEKARAIEMKHKYIGLNMHESDIK